MKQMIIFILIVGLAACHKTVSNGSGPVEDTIPLMFFNFDGRPYSFYKTPYYWHDSTGVGIGVVDSFTGVSLTIRALQIPGMAAPGTDSSKYLSPYQFTVSTWGHTYNATTSALIFSGSAGKDTAYKSGTFSAIFIDNYWIHYLTKGTFRGLSH